MRLWPSNFSLITVLHFVYIIICQLTRFQLVICTLRAFYAAFPVTSSTVLEIITSLANFIQVQVYRFRAALLTVTSQIGNYIKAPTKIEMIAHLHIGKTRVLLLLYKAGFLRTENCRYYLNWCNATFLEAITNCFRIPDLLENTRWK